MLYFNRLTEQPQKPIIEAIIIIIIIDNSLLSVMHYEDLTKTWSQTCIELIDNRIRVH
jgi:hypothetical protein